MATQRLADAQTALAEQIAQRTSLENHISLLTGNLERAKAELHDALGAAESLATNPARLEELEHTIKEMESKASSLLERHKSGSLVGCTPFLLCSTLAITGHRGGYAREASYAVRSRGQPASTGAKIQ